MNTVTKKEINKTMIEEAVRNILVALGENPDREGLMETPKRVAKAYAEIFDGINYTNEELATMYDKGFTDSDLEQTHTGFGDFVLIKNINAYSVCEHHMLPMLLDVHVAYIPKDKVMGLSKIPRIVKHVTKRLQLQERIGKDIYDVMNLITGSEDICVIIEGRHMCVEMRGVQDTSVTSTMYSGGVFKQDATLRRELLDCIERKN